MVSITHQMHFSQQVNLNDQLFFLLVGEGGRLPSNHRGKHEGLSLTILVIWSSLGLLEVSGICCSVYRIIEMPSTSLGEMVLGAMGWVLMFPVPHPLFGYRLDIR